MSKPEVRVRFAPSPTGYLHVGGARTALYNYLFAKKHGGKFILRIEDTDLARSTEDSLKMVIEDLQWLGLQWDEGPDARTLKDVGPYGPYYQSRRLELYKKYADEIISKDQAYYCFMTDDEIDVQRKASMAAGGQPHIHSPYADWPLDKALAEIKSGKKAVVRFRTKNLKRDYILQDMVRGEVKFPSDMVGDFVLLRSDGMPVYNFCCVVDDALMKISHVFRAEEHLSNTLRQMMIYDALGMAMPKFGHISLILDDNRQKLSKRAGATSCHEFKEMGYQPEALLNFIALLGWSSPEGKEIMPVPEMAKQFDIDRLQVAGAVFDKVKLKWMNSQYLRALSDQDLWQAIQPFLKREGFELPNNSEWQNKSVQAFKVKMETFADAVELYRPLSDPSFQILPEADEVYAWETTKTALEVWKSELQGLNKDYLTEEEFNNIQDEVKVKANVKGKNLFMPIRVAVIGKPHGTELKILVPLISKQSLLRRADMALSKCKQVGV